MDPNDPDTIFAHNLNMVMRSTDGGCSWKVVYRIARRPADPGEFTSPFSTMLELFIPPSPRSKYRIYITFMGLAGPKVMRSQRGDPGTWERADAGIDWGVRPPNELAFSPSDPETMYAAEHGDLRVWPNGLYVSHDSGTSWEPLFNPIDYIAETVTRNGGGNEQGFGLRVDPRDPKKLWAWAWGYASGVLTSRDGGKSWNYLPFAVSPSTVLLGSGPSRDDVVILPSLDCDERYQEDRCSLIHSTDGGTSWDVLQLPVTDYSYRVTSAVLDTNKRRVLATGFIRDSDHPRKDFLVSVSLDNGKTKMLPVPPGWEYSFPHSASQPIDGARGFWGTAASGSKAAVVYVTQRR